MHRRAAVLALGFVLTGCDDAVDPTSTSTASSTSSFATTSASSSSAGGGGAACASNEIPIVDQGDRLYVPATIAGEQVYFFLDTGSALTFVSLGAGQPNFVPDAAEATFGCNTLSLPGRGGLASLGKVNGKDVVGFMGVDFLVAPNAFLDRQNKTLTAPAPTTAIDASASWSALAYDDVQGMIIAPVTLDTKPVRLMLDTGAQHTLWLGEQGQPGDTEVTTTDAEGTPLTLYLGTASLEMASRAPVSVPVLRAPSFPYFEKTVMALGGNVHGLLGLSAFQERRMLFDGGAHVVRLAP